MRSVQNETKCVQATVIPLNEKAIFSLVMGVVQNPTCHRITAVMSNLIGTGDCDVLGRVGECELYTN